MIWPVRTVPARSGRVASHRHDPVVAPGSRTLLCLAVALSLVMAWVAVGSVNVMGQATATVEPVPAPPFPAPLSADALPPPPFPAPVLPVAPLGEAVPVPPGGTGGAFVAAATEHVTFFVQAGVAIPAAELAAAYGPLVERAHAEGTMLFAVETPASFAIYAYADAVTYGAMTRDLPAGATDELGIIAEPGARRVHLHLARLANRSSLEIENALRHVTTRVVLDVASGGNLPRGFAEGMALYVEHPITPRLARIAALVTTANQGGSLLSWSDLNRRRPLTNEQDLSQAESYAAVAFLLDRYGFRSFRAFLDQARTQPDWRMAMRAAYYNRGASEIEAQWRDNLPRWTGGDWRANLVAALDLEQPRQALLSGDYAGARAALEQSYRLYTDLGDGTRVQETEELLALSETGIQAETAMTQAQQALELHTYDRAGALVTQARSQYALLPPEHQPGGLLETYERTAASGLAAIAALEEAELRVHRWSDYRQARSAALDAGSRFAALGDDELRDRADTVLTTLEARQRRLVLLLGALAAVTAAWLALWLWTRGPAPLDWG